MREFSSSHQSSRKPSVLARSAGHPHCEMRQRTVRSDSDVGRGVGAGTGPWVGRSVGANVVVGGAVTVGSAETAVGAGEGATQNWPPQYVSHRPNETWHHSLSTSAVSPSHQSSLKLGGQPHWVMKQPGRSTSSATEDRLDGPVDGSGDGGSVAGGTTVGPGVVPSHHWPPQYVSQWSSDWRHHGLVMTACASSHHSELNPPEGQPHCDRKQSPAAVGMLLGCREGCTEVLGAGVVSSGGTHQLPPQKFSQRKFEPWHHVLCTVALPPSSHHGSRKFPGHPHCVK